MTTIQQSNARTWTALAAVRVRRSIESMSELYDALNARNRSRNIHLTESEKENLTRKYLLENAPDLLQ